MLPQDAGVLLVEADGVGDGAGFALLVGEHGVEVADLAHAVAAEGQRVGEAAETPLADVEGVLPPVQGPRVAVGDHHLADRRPAQDRPAVVRDVAQNDPLERIEADVEGPALPAQHVAVDLEPDPVGLGDDERRQAGPRGVVLGEVAAGVVGQRDDPAVDQLEHLAAGHVHQRLQALDRAGVAVVAGLLAVEADAAGHPPALLGRDAEVARGPGVDLHLGEVGDAPGGQGGPESLVLVQRGDGHEALPEPEGWADVVVGHPADDLAGVQRHRRLDDRGLGPRDDHQPGPAAGGGAPGVVDRDGREGGRGCEAPGRPHRGHGDADLFRGQRVEGVGHGSRHRRRRSSASSWVKLRLVPQRNSGGTR